MRDYRATTEVNLLLSLLDRAFAGEEWYSLLTNLRTTRPVDWDWVPEAGQRSIRQIVQHVGGCKFMYTNHAFGDQRLQWDDPVVVGAGNRDNLLAAIPWLTAGHEHLRTRIARLSDADLNTPRMTNWGEMKETRWIITTLIEHDIYHAGEINHLRSLHDGDDRWAYDRRPL
jgi:hypothetical protein